MKFKELSIEGVFEIDLEPKEDERGYFVRTYDEEIFRKLILPINWPEESESFSRRKGTVRGLHFQHPPRAEAKMVRALNGEAFFAFVDLRKKFTSFGKWGSVTLSSEKKNAIFVPRGFALGMCSLTDNFRMHYKMDNVYDHTKADAIRWNDPSLAINWPIERPSIISEKDEKAKSFREFMDLYGGF